MAESGSTSQAPAHRNNTIAWLAVAVALSPVLADTLQHAHREGWARPALLFAVALAVRAWRSPREAARAPAWGFALVLVAALAGAALSAADWPRFGRLAIPLCVLGLAARTGRPTLGIAGIAIWCVPVPSFVLEVASPGLENAWARLAQLLAPSDARFAFALAPEDGGIALAWWLAGSGYIRALSLQREGFAALPLCAAGALAAFPIQLAAIAAALLASGSGSDAGSSPAQIAWLLREVFPLGVVGLAVGLAPWRPHAHLRR